MVEVVTNFINILQNPSQILPLQKNFMYNECVIEG
jgi:hypothetical protein